MMNVQDLAFWQEDEITSANVADLLGKANIRHEIDHYGDFSVETETLRLAIVIDHQRKMLKLLSFFQLPSLATKEAMANRLNRLFPMLVFHTDDGDFVAEYHFTFEGGLIPAHLIFNLQKFEQLLYQAISEAAAVLNEMQP